VLLSLRGESKRWNASILIALERMFCCDETSDAFGVIFFV
jgi:hypothetical protein